MAASDMPQCVVYDLRGKDFLSTYKFQFEKVIDVGMCGEILLVSLLQNPDAKRVVKKFSLLDESRREKNIAAFYKEAKYLQYFDHPFLMKCYVAGTCAEYMAIGMTFYRRGTLDRYIGSICLQQSEVIVTQVACALRYMHNKNVAHIDVKLDNIFLSKNFDAILGDFGLAVELSEAQKTLAKGKCGGTPGYLAPERIAATPNNTEVDPYKIDSYCLGVVYWALIFEKMPAPNIHYYYEVRRKRDLPENTRRCLLKLLERDPSKRMSITEFLDIMRRDAGLRYVIDKY